MRKGRGAVSKTRGASLAGRSKSRTLSARINELFIAEDTARAKEIIRAQLKESPNDHWLMTRLASVYTMERRYGIALRWATRALSLAPWCPLVRWDLACALDGQGKHEEAIALWQQLISDDVDALAEGRCGEGRRWAQSLVNDCRYRVGRAYELLGRDARAMAALTKHIAMRAPGVPSLYPARLVRRRLDALCEKHVPKALFADARREDRYVL